ncbi:unnamed protein product [Microthlaspi erraticum]|uniref:F-box domain-containing protein n=1 Tax=Microthlaspi erraticum TaxID=1685480 RepID=A0A6D2KSV6_9BRAS|nr:unnamed protein product [Microthlaspi erraticum]
MSSPERKGREKKEPSSESAPNPSLPHDLVLSCIARVSRLYYPTLSLVSKSFRSLIASPELYKARSLLGHTESCLYVCIQVLGDNSPNWYTLCRKPNKTTKSSSGYVLAAVPVPDAPLALLSGSGLVAVGSNIYNIGGSDLNSMAEGSYSRVTVLDCRSHTLSEAPSLRVALRSLSASVVDRNIYVVGSCRAGDTDLKNSYQVLDTKAQVWDHVPCGETEVVGIDKTVSFKDKFHVVGRSKDGGRKVVAYDPKERKWEAVDRHVGWFIDPGASCEIGNVLYATSRCLEERVLVWYDTEETMWRNVTGLVGLPKLTCLWESEAFRFNDFGGKMGFLWEGEAFRFNYSGFLQKKIWFAEIALERRSSCEIWGKVEWFYHVLTVPATSWVIKVLSATV